MDEDTSLGAAELHELRHEITTHFTLSNALVAVELAACGTGISVLNRSAFFLAGLALISSFLWVLWIDHSLQTHKIADTCLHVSEAMASSVSCHG